MKGSFNKMMQRVKKFFKALFENNKKQTYYLCDPKRATGCPKEGCWEIYRGPCKCTSKKEYAKLDANGKPIIAQDLDLWNAEYVESVINEELQGGDKVVTR